MGYGILWAVMLAMPQAEPPALQLKVAAVQFRSSFDVQDNMKRIVAALHRLADRGVAVAAFPECALTGYATDKVTAAPEEIAAAEEQILRACRERRIAAIVGSIHRVGGNTYNTAVVVSSKGELVERYAKVMLAGEKWATPGHHVALFELEGVPSTVIICHDERYPELVRLPVMLGARIVYYISHEAGMDKEWKLAGYRAQMMARAVENNVCAVAANAPANVKDNSGSHGQSRIIKNDGNVLQEASFYGEEVLVETLKIEKAQSEWLEKSLKGPLGEWWRQGMDLVLKNRSRKLGQPR